MGAKGFEEVSHPSDIGLRFEADSLEGLFENAGMGMFSLMTDPGKVRPRFSVDISIKAQGDAIEDLLILWLEKLLYYFEVESMLAGRIKVKRVKNDAGSAGLDAVIIGEKVDTGRHDIIKVIKAPTYQSLSIIKKDKIFIGTVIFDV